MQFALGGAQPVSCVSNSLLVHLLTYDCRLDPPGPTVLAYTPDGRRVITGGSNTAIRIYTVGEDGEPKTVDGAIDGHCAIGASNKYFLMGAEDGTVWQYDTVTGKQLTLLLRCALPVRDIAVSRDGEWAAVASE